MAEAGTKQAGTASGPSIGARIGNLLTVLNTLAVLGVLGLLVYTRLMFKRPAITEQSERQRLAELKASPTPLAVPGMMVFEPMTVNIESTPGQPRPADGTPQQIQGKLHYLTVGFAIELRDSRSKDDAEELRPKLMDSVLGILGRKSFHELTTVQGRYVLRTQILEAANDLAREARPAGPAGALATNVYFTQFIVQ